MVFWAAGKKRKGEKKKKRWTGWAEKEREKNEGFSIFEKIQTHSI
jgi:hypothetical protein